MTGLACILGAPHDPFAEMLAVELRRNFDEVRLLTEGSTPPPCALLLIDLDCHPIAESTGHRLGYTRSGRTAPFPVLTRPFRTEELRRLLRHPEGARATAVSADFRTVTVEGEVVTLTEREALLFRLLYEAKGAPVPRNVLCDAVFPRAREGEDSLNVYIHYLRKKLERSRKRLIRAHRGGGYSLLMEDLC